MSFNRVLFSSLSGSWTTPYDLFCVLDDEFHFTLDPCSSHLNALCDLHYTIDDDGLNQPWFGSVFVNPPYSRSIGAWIQKAFTSSLAGATVVMLVPARTDTRWFHEYCLPYAEIRFIRRRLRFGGSKHNAPFPSMIVIFRPTDPF